MSDLVLSSVEEGSFFKYLQEIKHIAFLDQEQEQSLAKRLIEHKDVSAAHKLVTSHLKLVVKIAYSFRGYKLPMMELVSEGNIGLMHAVKKFDPAFGFRLSTYAVWWIKAAIQEYILKSWSLVKMGTTAAQKKLFFNLNKIQKKLHSLHSSLTNEQTNTVIANELQVSEKEVMEMRSRMRYADLSLNAPISDNNESQLLEMIPENRPNQEVILGNTQEANYKKNMLKSAMGLLNDRERSILVDRHLKEEPETLETLSKLHKISRERVRQIESRALEKITQYVQDHNVVCA
jgi:RNA polymerase sigma-32 factor